MESRDLPFDKEVLTGYTIINAKNLDEAEKIANRCPIIINPKIYDIKKHSILDIIYH